MKQTFAFNDNTRVEMTVLAQMSYKYDAMSIQISKVKEPETNEVKYVYEEITNDTDEVQYCHYMSENGIRQQYPWAVHMLPLVPLTKKQSEVLRWVLNDDAYEGAESMIWIESFCEMVSNGTGYTIKAVEGILSSLWVKGYITCNILAGPGVRYFTIEASALEYLKGKSKPEAIAHDDEEEGEEDE